MGLQVYASFSTPYLEGLKTCLQAYACEHYHLHGDETKHIFTKAEQNDKTF